MKSKIALVLVLLVTVMLPSIRCAVSAESLQPVRAVSVFNVASTVLSGIEVKNHDTYVIENGYFVINGAITVKENGTLIIRNATLDFNETNSFLDTYGNTTVSMSNVTVYNAGAYFYSYIRGTSSLTVAASTFSGSSYFYLYDTCRTSFAGSRAYCLSASGNARVSVSSTTVQYFYCYGMSVARISQSIVCYLYVENSSNVFVSDSVISDRITLEFRKDSIVSLSVPEGMVDLWSLYGNATVTKAYVNLTLVATWVTLWNLNFYDTAAVTVARSNLDSISAYSNASVRFVQGSVGYLYLYDYSNITLVDSIVTGMVSMTFAADSKAALSLHEGQFSHWNLHADNVVSSVWSDLTLQNVSVAGWEISSYSSVISLTDSSVRYLNAYDNSTIAIRASFMNGIYGYDYSLLTITSTNLDWADIYGNSTMNVENSTVTDIYAYDNSTVSAKRVRTDYIGVYDSASVLLVDSFTNYGIEMSFVQDTKLVLPALPGGNVEYWNLYKNASVTKAYLNLTLVKTKVRGWADFSASDEAIVSLKGCFFDYIYCEGLSVVTLTDSVADTVYVYDNSTLSITNSSVHEVQLVLKGDSDISFNSLPTGWVDHWNLYVNALVAKAYINCSIAASWIEQWGFNGYDHASLSFKHCIIDDISVYDSCNLSLDNCTVSYVDGYTRSHVSLVNTVVLYNAYAYDDSVWTIANSDLQSRLYLKFKADSEVYGLSFPTGLISHWSLSNVTNVKRIFLNLTLTNSKVKAWGIYVYGFSAISIVNSNVDYFTAYDFSDIAMKNCTVGTLYLNKLSQLQLNSVPGWKSAVVNLYTYGMSTATLNESRVATVNANAYSAVNLIASEFGATSVYNSSKVLVTRSVDVHMIDTNGKSIVSANVTVRSLSGAFARSMLTGSDGWARFEVPERTIDVSGNHPAGNYTVSGVTGGYNVSRVIDVTENKEIVIVVPFTVSEFSDSWLLLIIVSITIIVVLTRKRTRR